MFDFQGVFENRSIYFQVYGIRKPKCASKETLENQGTTVLKHKTIYLPPFEIMTIKRIQKWQCFQ